MTRFGAFLAGLVLALALGQAWAQTGSSTLNWLPATTYSDGSPLTLDRQDIYRGPAVGSLLLLTTVGPGIATYVDSGLFNGTYCYAVTSVDANGLESAFSNVACKSIADTGNIPIPNAPTNLTVL